MVRLACIGTGYICTVHAQSCRSLDTVELAAVYSRREDSGGRVAKEFFVPRVYTDYGELLNDENIDAVIIGVPTPMHKEFAVRAAQAGKHIFCEKPIALTVKDGEEMIRIAKENGVILMIGHVLRFWPEYVTTKSVIDGGVMGSIKSLEAYRLSAPPEWSSGSWLLDVAQSGGVPVDLQIHDIDFIRWMLGEPVSVKASGTIVNSNLIDSVVSIFQYKKAIAYSEAGYILSRAEKFKMGFRIVCENGVIEYSNQSNPMLAMTLEGKPFTHPPVSPVDPYTSQISYFVKCIRERRYPEQCPPSDSLRALESALQVKHIIEGK